MATLFFSAPLDVEIALQYNRARYYDSATGRWLSQDPLGFAAGDSNLYRYVKNIPTINNDPIGFQERSHYLNQQMKRLLLGIEQAKNERLIKNLENGRKSPFMIPFLPETVELSPKNIPRNAPRPINGTKLDGLADNPYEPNSLITLQSQINALRKVIADIDNEYLHNIARRESEATRTTDEDRAKIFSFHQKCFCSKRQNAQKALEESEGMYLLERGRISQAFYKTKDQLTGGPYWQWGNYEETQQQKFVMKGLVTVGSFGKGGVYILLANGVWAFAEGDYVEGTLSCAPAALKVLGRFAPGSGARFTTIGGGRVGPEFNPQQLQQILRNLERQGVVIDTGADALRLLERQGAGAMYMAGNGSRGTLILRPGATRLEVMEELVHHGQWNGVQNVWDNTTQFIGNLSNQIRHNPGALAHAIVSGISDGVTVLWAAKG